MKGKYAAAAGLALAAVAVWPVAAQAEPPPPERSLMKDCKNAERLDGERNEKSLPLNGRQPKNCWVLEKGVDDYYAPPFKATQDFGNCNGKSPLTMVLNMTNTFEQRKGKYFAEQPGWEVEILKIVNIAWRKHTGTLNLDLETVTLSSGAFIDVPPGYKAWATWSQHMLRQDRSWVIEYAGDYHGQRSWQVDDESEGPLRVPGGNAGKLSDDKGAEGVMDGILKVESKWCGPGDPPSQPPSIEGGTRPLIPDLPDSGSRPWDPESDGPLSE